LGKKKVEKLAIVTVGSFDDDGKPKGWEFKGGKSVKPKFKKDGTFTLAGYTSAELAEIAEEAAINGTPEPDDDKEPAHEPEPEVEPEVDGDGGGETVVEEESSEVVTDVEVEVEIETISENDDVADDFSFGATLTGAAFKKPANMPVQLEVKILTGELSESEGLGAWLGRDVDIIIRSKKHEYARKKPERVEKEGEKKEAISEPDQSVVSYDDETGETVTEAVCENCGGELKVNPDDTKQLICGSCEKVHVNPDAEEMEFD